MATPVILPSGEALDFNYGAYDGSAVLPAALKIYDLSSGSPVLVTTLAATHVFGGGYYATYTFPGTSSGKRYFIHFGIYTDGTFTTLDLRAPSVDTVKIDGFENPGRTV